MVSVAEEASVVEAQVEAGSNTNLTIKMKNILILIVLLGFVTSCIDKQGGKEEVPTSPYLLILGNAQDAGYPQAGCEKECCQRVYNNRENERFVSSIALIDPISNENWIFDATPDFPKQLKLLSKHLNKPGNLPNAFNVYK